jgi:hypothetical protein
VKNGEAVNVGAVTKGEEVEPLHTDTKGRKVLLPPYTAVLKADRG